MQDNRFYLARSQGKYTPFKWGVKGGLLDNALAVDKGELEAPRHLDRKVHDLYLAARRVPTANNVVALERFHFGVQGTGVNPGIVGRLPSSQTS